jgi:hypothetical protein
MSMAPTTCTLVLGFMSDLQRIIEALPHLTQTELKSVKVRIGFLLKVGNQTDVETSTEELLVLDAIVSVLSSMGLEFPQVHLLKKRSNPAFREKVGSLFKYLNHSGLVRIEIRGLLLVGVKLLVDNMKGGSLPISGGTIMRNIGRIPSLINQAFPLYAESGILHMIVRRNVAR